MDTFEDLIGAVQDDVTINDNSTLFPLPLVKRAINRAKRKTEGLFRWPPLEDALKISGEAGEFYYDYPERWRPDSIWKIVVDSEDYGKPLAFEDYLYEKENSIPSGKDYFWANQWKRFFIYPTPTADGTENIDIFGIKSTVDLVADGDETIFSYSMPEVNEAIVLEAVKILKSKGEEQQSGEMLSAEAKAMIALAWSRIKQDSAKEVKTQPMLNVTDMFSGRGNRGGSETGNF